MTKSLTFLRTNLLVSRSQTVSPKPLRDNSQDSLEKLGSKGRYMRTLHVPVRTLIETSSRNGQAFRIVSGVCREVKGTYCALATESDSYCNKEKKKLCPRIMHHSQNARLNIITYVDVQCRHACESCFMPVIRTQLQRLLPHK